MLEHKNLEQFSGFNHAKINLESPWKFNSDMEWQQLTLMCGMNGVGKSFINKLMWSNVFIMNLFLIEDNYGVKLNDSFTREETMEYVFNKSFTEFEEFNGFLRFYSTDKILEVPHYILEFNITDGKITDLDIDYPTGAVPCSTPMYLTKETRQFTAFEQYLNLKNLMGVDNLESFDNIDKLTSSYPLYDIFALEMMIAKFPNLNLILEKVATVNDLLDGLDIVGIEYNKDKKNLMYEKADGSKKRIVSLGSGHQALLILLIGSVPTEMSL